MLLERLRSETRPQHERLERNLDLLRPDYTIEEYGELLRQWYLFLHSWEEKAGRIASPATQAEIASRSKSPLLVRDIRNLNLEFAGQWESMDLDFVCDRASVLGSMYVLEGSTLGGQLLSRHFNQQFGLTPEYGAAFLYAYGPRTSTMWKSFCNHLIAESQREEHDRIVESAKHTFGFLDEWLCPKVR